MSLQALIEKIKNIEAKFTDDRPLVILLRSDVKKLCEAAEVYHISIENLRSASKINEAKMDKMIVRNATGLALKSVGQICKDVK